LLFNGDLLDMLALIAEGKACYQRQHKVVISASTRLLSAPAQGYQRQ
jgi:hypothetical protein